MTKYKRFLQSIGYKLEKNYPCIPFPLDRYNRDFLEEISTGIDGNGVYITTYYNTIVLRDYIGRDGKMYKQECL